MEKVKNRYFYLDNVRIFLTILVVLHHWAIANGAPGDWYLTENYLKPVESVLLTMFIATNQSFFMGFFFMLAAYFITDSYNKKGGRKFIKDRMKRLGIPFLVYTFVISPAIRYLIYLFIKNKPSDIIEFLVEERNIFSSGPLWFVELLLIFNVIYYLLNRFIHPAGISKSAILKYKTELTSLFIVVLIFATYFVRIYFPTGYWIPVLNIQPAHFTQYLLFFTAGLMAKHLNLFGVIKLRQSVRVFIISNILIVIIPMVLFLFKNQIEVDQFMGGSNMYSFGYVMWEQITAILLIISIIGIFRCKLNFQNALTLNLSKNTFMVYIIHSIIIVAISILFYGIENYSFIKFVVVSPVILLFCFMIADFLNRFLKL